MTHELVQTLSRDMFHLPIPVVEKILRPVIVYICLIAFLRLFGKRELAQLNPFDLVVLLSLSNTVQNAIIGDDNSVLGGIIGALTLLAINWLLMWVLYRAPRVNTALEGSPTTLIRNGMVDVAAVKHEAMTHEELISVLNRNGFNDPAEVEICILEPNGTFYVKGKQPSTDQIERAELLATLNGLRDQVIALRKEMAGGGAS
ncbi:MAG TPA: YetF domain-containing protein [Acidobacteriaceae bacterium]|nr:YetF domain-containing protein [Acidobacteriaceae bacterium]